MKTFNVGSIKWQTKQMSEIKHAIWLGQSRSVQEIFAFKQTAAFLLGHSLNVSPPPAPINLHCCQDKLYFIQANIMPYNKDNQRTLWSCSPKK